MRMLDAGDLRASFSGNPWKSDSTRRDPSQPAAPVIRTSLMSALNTVQGAWLVDARNCQSMASDRELFHARFLRFCLQNINSLIHGSEKLAHGFELVIIPAGALVISGPTT